MVPEIIKPHHMVTFYYNKNPEKHICKEQNTNKTSMVQETPSILRSKRPRHNSNTRQHNCKIKEEKKIRIFTRS
jgi:hypothetical protein